MAEAPEVERLFHALGDRTRRAILDALARGPRSVSSLAEPIGVTVTAIAQHLRVLEEAGLAKTEKLGRVRICRIEPKGFDRLDVWGRTHRSLWELGLDRLANFLDDEDPD